MKESNSNNDIVKWLLLIIVSVGCGTFITNILGNTEINIWLSRTIGALVTGGISLILYHLLIKNAEVDEERD